ncbi:hypothetical protein MSG28_010222 [Choristoneura fumiferana]|uniref:Uncharacterized protein n=1 Tax=Choristoneura fumiferana TaxID=7141 RepID=A0ACC0KKJ2_CHOFU|nr:hypothetical protein MSG28_010222 [Choristoneura fumiferana]
MRAPALKNFSIAMKMKDLDRAIIATSILGVVVSTYSLHVEMSVAAEPEYKAYCDLGEKVSCSKVLTSEYATGFGLVAKGSLWDIPNCIYGIFFYCLMVLLATYDDLRLVRVQFAAALTAVLSCVYLAYLLLFVLHDLCIVCLTTYIVNAVLITLIYKKMNYLAKKQYIITIMQ